MTRIVQATFAPQIEAVRRLFTDYAASLEIDLSFQDFERELSSLPGDYVPPLGALFLAVDDDVDQAIGCVALRQWEADVAELKRLYVTPAGRGRGLGLALTHAALDEARALGYARVRLDTLPSMECAQALYERLGFREIDAYRFNPIEEARYMELDLNAASERA